MNTRDQAIALMRELDLAPDNAATSKWQTAIECALDEAIHLRRIHGQCPRCLRRELFVGAGGRLTCANAECPEPTAASDFLDQIRYLDTEQTAGPGADLNGCPRLAASARDLADAAAQTVCHPRRFLNNADGEQQVLSVALIRVRQAMNIPPTKALPNRGALGLKDELDEIRSERDVAQTDFGHLYRDYCNLKEQAARLLKHLDGSDGYPAAWWIEAADAARKIGEILWPEEKAEKALRETDQERV